MKLQREIILENIPKNLRAIISNIPPDQFKSLQEIRLRLGKPLMADADRGPRFISRDGTLTRTNDSPYIVTAVDLRDTLELMSESSVYAFIDEIKRGFITIRGGNRVGICGRAVLSGGEVSNIRDISGINIRIAREIPGAADAVMSAIYDKKTVRNTLVISPPQAGKTTMLRDIARQLGGHVKIGLVDERGELAASYKGLPQHDVGLKTDVMDLCPKHLGMLMLLRSMSPDVIITDEIATNEDLDAIEQVINSGVKIIASAHGFDLTDIRRRMNCEKYFEKIIVLSNKDGVRTHEILDN